jgi:hypothetical protein
MKLRQAAIIVLGMALLATPVAARDAAVQAGPHGYIYGTVETTNDHSYTGMLRWGTEETFWDDLFNSTKSDLPYLEEHHRESRQRNRIKVLGITVGYRWDDSSDSRMFIARFGDIAQIEMPRGDKINVTMKDGSEFSMTGGSNDVGATITVQDDSLGAVKLAWEKIERVTFKPTPAGLEPPGYRLFGKLTTKDETFEGYIQWDVQECLSTDELDGESDDGDMSIAMGRIRAIEKRNRRGSLIVLKDGREFVLEGTNDVDSSMRGVHVDDPRFGRVTVNWEAFERVEFEEVDHSGRAYGDYGPAKRLRGSVVDYDGKSHSGELVFDLDETASWELLNGSLDDVEYSIPFGMLRSIEPTREDGSVVTLAGGATATLYDGQDVSERNDGVVVIRENGRETYFTWDEIKRIEFE